MKRHHLATVFCLTFAALSLYKAFQTGEMGRAIWIFIGFLVLGGIGFFYDRFRRWLRPVMLAIPVILLLFFGYQHLRDGEILQFSIVFGVLIVGGGLTLLQDRRVIQERVSRYTSLVPVIVLTLLLVWEMYSLFADDRPVGRGTEYQAETATNSVVETIKSRQQRMRDIVTSDEFITQMKAAAKVGTEPKALQSLSSFRDSLVSQGMTEYADLDLSPSAVEQHFQGVFQKHYPGKDPKDLDPEMRQRFIETIEKYGVERGRMKFVLTREVALWGTGRFNLFEQGGETISTWMNSIDVDDFRDRDIEEVPVSTPPSQQEDTFSDTFPLDAPAAEMEQVSSDHTLQEAWEEPTRPDTEKRGLATPTGEQEKVVTGVSPKPPALPTDAEFETTLKERFSSERFERAMSTLERYGPEEGLRRLKENDPEIAEQVERRRKREDKEEDY